MLHLLTKQKQKTPTQLQRERPAVYNTLRQSREEDDTLLLTASVWGVRWLFHLKCAEKKALCVSVYEKKQRTQGVALIASIQTSSGVYLISGGFGILSWERNCVDQNRSYLQLKSSVD